MKKRFWIIGGVAVAAAGLTAVGAMAQRGGDGEGWRGGHHGGGYHHRGGGGHHGWRGRGGDEDGRGRGRRWRRDITKDDFDAQTRARFAKWDENGDGTVTKDEVEKRITARMERRMNRRGGRGPGMRMMRRFDENGDGTLTKDEVEAYVTKMFARMDLDGDGRITDADLPPLMRGLDVIKGDGPRFGMGGPRGHRMRGHGKRRHGGRGGAHGMGMLRHMLGADTNKDNEISIEEAQALAAKRMARFDRNNDGKIDDADREALKAEMIDYRVRRFLHRFEATPEQGLTLEAFTKFRNERFAARDKDGDGVISRNEMRRGGPGAGRGRGRHERRGWRHGQRDGAGQSSGGAEEQERGDNPSQGDAEGEGPRDERQ